MKKSRFGSIETVKLALEFWSDIEHCYSSQVPIKKYTVNELNKKTGSSLPTTVTNLSKLVQIGLVDKIPKNKKDSFYKSSAYLQSMESFEDVVKSIIEYENN